MGDMDYNPNPTFNNIEAAPENNNDDNDNVDDKRRALPLRIPQSRGSDSPSVQTPMSDIKNKTQSWYYASMYPGYKARRKEFRDLFGSSGSPGSRFVVDYSCAYHRDILHQGRLYVTTSSCCFYSYIFGWENKVTIPWTEVVTITKEKTAIFIPNAIQISTADNKYFFASFVDRESSHMMLVRLWQAVASNKALADEDVDQLIACEYGEGDEAEVGPGIVDDVEEEEAKEGKTVNNNNNNNTVPVARWLRDCEGDVVLDHTFSRPLAEVFRLLYSNDNFYFNFQKERGTTELDIGAWEEGGEGDKVREVRYNMELNNPVGPKKCQVKETQVLREEARMMTVDTVADNSGVPYADSFSVLTHNCLLDTGPASTRLIAKAEIRFKKELWGFLKDKIETNAWSGIRSYYSSLSAALEDYSEEAPQQASLQPKPKTRHGGQDSASAVSILRPWLVGVTMVVLLLTSLINTFILYRLSLLSAPPPPPVMPPLDPPRHAHLPRDQGGWLQLVTRQAELHNSRTQLLRQQLSAATEHIAAAEAVMEDMRSQLEQWKPFDWMEHGDGSDCGEGNQFCDQSNIEKISDQTKKIEF